LLLSIGSLTLLSLFIFQRSKQALQKEVFNHLESVAENKSGEVLNHFQTIQKGAFLISKTSLIKNAFTSFENEFKKISQAASLREDSLNKIKELVIENYYRAFITKTNDTLVNKEALSRLLPSNPEALILQHELMNNVLGRTAVSKGYGEVFDAYDEEIREFIANLPFSKLSFIDAEGFVIYSQGDQRELGASVFSSAFSESGISEKFKLLSSSKADTGLYCDYSPYVFNLNAQIPFLIKPLFEKNTFKGALLFEISSAELNQIVNFNYRWYSNGMGRTGAAYLIDTNYRMLTDARFFLEDKAQFIEDLRNNDYPESSIVATVNYKSTVGNIRIVNAITNAVRKSKRVSLLYKDYLGYEVLAVAKQINIYGLKWSLIMRIRTEEAFAELEAIKRNILWATLLTILFSILFAFVLSYRITKPLSMLTANAYELSKGNFSTPITIKGKDELFELASGFKVMQTQILGLITELRESNTRLDDKQREIFESIRYASKIQENILASPEFLSERLPDHFVYFNPKEIVSGDFYWACEANEKKGELTTNYFYLAACDSTGHGIPGAFMSLLNVNYLNQAIIEMGKRNTGEIFDHVKMALSEVFESHGNKDGMDGILIRIEKNNPVIQYTAANNKPILIRDQELTCLSYDKMGVGKGLKSEPFVSYTIEVRPNDVLYLISDGFPDQFGGEKNKKYKYNRFYEFLLSIHRLPPSEQHLQLKKEFDSWTRGYEQTDDVLVVGIRF
jgi:serine phosphatase RsbU (regulator of sigma subunit)/HAMP domain-containing protein